MTTLESIHGAIFVQFVTQCARADTQLRRCIGPIAPQGLQGLHDQPPLHLMNREANLQAVAALEGWTLSELAREVCWREAIARGDHDGTLHVVLEFTHISGPIVTGEQLERLVLKALDLLAIFLVVALDE